MHLAKLAIVIPKVNHFSFHSPIDPFCMCIVHLTTFGAHSLMCLVLLIWPINWRVVEIKLLLINDKEVLQCSMFKFQEPSKVEEVSKPLMIVHFMV
jgi:hypothetical protein